MVPTTPAFVEITTEQVVEAEPIAVQLQVQGMSTVLLTFDRLPDATCPQPPHMATRASPGHRRR